ncbi:hypothetical protein [Shewanella chilikensis]|uniref:ORC-CDC6 family AAA ATPase n=1 Tax=Shewanella chilikensis TaxID=558541 RepID=UPI001CD19725|nr:hypothetical protein [Shewanella chilikensis]MCA0948669.1 hypothetical protein [Shewanella chilikensis]
MDKKKNPFNVVKAGDFSDTQINEFWVDFPADNGFDTIAKPTSTMPMIIKGGKGSGKTHLMRNYSFQLQKLRHKEQLLDGIKADGYMGCYLKLGGLNTKRFHGKKIDDETWLSIFSYYIDIWLSQIFLDNILKLSEYLSIENEQEICQEIIKLFDIEIALEKYSFSYLIEYLNDLQKDIDLKVNNCLWQELSVDIKTSPGKLIFGIPKIFASHIDDLKSIVFVYLIDELENLFPFQQKYIQTLIREKELPCSIKVGARSHGIKTYETLAANEYNKDGSEFELITLEDKIRNNKNYASFARKLCLRRLTSAGYLLDIKSEKDLDFFFEDAPYYSPTSNIEKVETGSNGDTIKKLTNQLNSSGFKNISEEICLNLECKDMPLIEKAAVYCFYNDWNKNIQKTNLPEYLIKASYNLKLEIQLYLDRPNNSRLHSVLEHYKIDFIAQLMPNQNVRYLYTGLKNIIKISDGFPRNLLTIFKDIFEYADFNGEKPFEKEKISRNSQIEGIIDATEWFINDARMTGDDGNKLKISIGRIAELFRLNRFADKPRECSLTTFSINTEKASEETLRLIEIATQWSLLLSDSKGRKDRNSKRIDKKFRINYMISPFWELPIASRGVLAMSTEMVNSIFDKNHDENYIDELKKFKKPLTPPFSLENEKQESLF